MEITLIDRTTHCTELFYGNENECHTNWNFKAYFLNMFDKFSQSLARWYHGML